MDEIKNGNYPEPRSRQESYLQIIIGKIKEISNSEDDKCKCDGKIHIIDETTGKQYSGEIKIINNKPVLEYEEIK